MLPYYKVPSITWKSHQGNVTNETIPEWTLPAFPNFLVHSSAKLS